MNFLEKNSEIKQSIAPPPMEQSLIGGCSSLALAAKNGQLVAEEGVLYDQIHSAARSVVGDRGSRGLIVWRCPVPQQAEQRLTQEA